MAVHELLLRLAEQQAAITAAQVALHRLVELGLAQNAAVGAPTGPQDAPNGSVAAAIARSGASDSPVPMGGADAATVRRYFEASMELDQRQRELKKVGKAPPAGERRCPPGGPRSPANAFARRGDRLDTGDAVAAPPAPPARAKRAGLEADQGGRFERPFRAPYGGEGTWPWRRSCGRRRSVSRRSTRLDQR